jgi:hypothetical protein
LTAAANVLLAKKDRPIGLNQDLQRKCLIIKPIGP